MTGEQIRLNRLFSSGNVVIVAVDHGLYNGPLPGLIDLPRVVQSIVDADAILMSPGMPAHCADVFAKRGAPSLIVRLNWGTQYATQWNYATAHSVPMISARDALALGADIALAGFSLHTGDERMDADNIAVLAAHIAEKRAAGIPLVGEFYPAGAEDLAPETLQEQVAVGCRIAAELGADMIKTFYTGKYFDKIVAVTPAPIFGLGARKTPREIDALRLAANEVRSGARGVVFGRNVVQARDPKRFLDALKEVVKASKDPEEVAKKFGIE
jgi:DhnA family fructose-bisphosphate aldolase class Ia